LLNAGQSIQAPGNGEGIAAGQELVIASPLDLALDKLRKEISSFLPRRLPSFDVAPRNAKDGEGSSPINVISSEPLNSEREIPMMVILRASSLEPWEFPLP